MNEQERENAPAHAGAGDSFPLGPGCRHVEAAWNLRGHGGNKAGHEARIRKYAKAHGCSLPDTAKKGLEADDSNLVHKAYNPVGKTWMVEKAWETDDGSLAIEGWVSTNHPDLEKDIVEPEAFYGETFEEYFGRSAPLSSNHDTDGYPIGHLQKGVLVRDGVIFQEAEHPTDPAEFQHFDPARKGTGWYARGVITDPRVASHVKKGNMGAFSWIGNLKAYEPLVGGGRRYHEVDPLIESTVAAYPVNPKAVMQIAKAYGLSDKEEQMDKNPEQNPLDLEQLMVKAAEIATQKAQEAAALAAKGTVQVDQIGELFRQFETRIDAKLEAVKKATTPVEGEVEETVQKAAGVGRKSSVSTDPREDNPVRYLVQKGRAAAKDGKDLPYDDTDKQVIWGLTLKGLSSGMLYDQTDNADFGDLL